MIEIARVEQTSRIDAERYVERWCDLATHPEWSAGMEYLRLSEPFGLGARGELKTRGGAPAAFVITELVPGSVYADTTVLEGAELTVRHEAMQTPQGTRLVVTAALNGPQAQSWMATLGDAVQRDLDADLASLSSLLTAEVDREPSDSPIVN